MGAGAKEIVSLQVAGQYGEIKYHTEAALERNIDCHRAAQKSGGKAEGCDILKRHKIILSYLTN